MCSPSCRTAPQPKAKRALQGLGRRRAPRLGSTIHRMLQVKYEKAAAECPNKDRDVLLTFYDFLKINEVARHDANFRRTQFPPAVANFRLSRATPTALYGTSRFTFVHNTYCRAISET
jgi:hypothetical protein